MYGSGGSPELILNEAVAAIVKGGDSLLSVLDALPAPIYVTDPNGTVTHFNSACIDFAGRTPVAGEDRWCVTWKLYTYDGQFLPHDACPMADAIKAKRRVRGAIAIAERPDGTRVRFMPYPTPIFAEDGSLLCAVNMLVDVTDERQAASFRAQADKCRRHANSIGHDEARAALLKLALEYEARAEELKRH